MIYKLYGGYGPVGPELLTHHHGGNKIDEDFLPNGFPLRQSTEKCLRTGSRKKRGLRRQKNCFGSHSRGFLNICEFIGLELGQMQPRWAHKLTWHAPLGARHLSLWPPWSFFGASLSFQGLFMSIKIVKKFCRVWTSFVWIYRKTKNMQKMELALGIDLIR